MSAEVVSLVIYLFRVESIKNASPPPHPHSLSSFVNSQNFVYRRKGSNQRIFEYNDPFFELL